LAQGCTALHRAMHRFDDARSRISPEDSSSQVGKGSPGHLSITTFEKPHRKTISSLSLSNFFPDSGLSAVRFPCHRPSPRGGKSSQARAPGNTVPRNPQGSRNPSASAAFGRRDRSGARAPHRGASAQVRGSQRGGRAAHAGGARDSASAPATPSAQPDQPSGRQFLRQSPGSSGRWPRSRWNKLSSPAKDGCPRSLAFGDRGCPSGLAIQHPRGMLAGVPGFEKCRSIHNMGAPGSRF